MAEWRQWQKVMSTQHKHNKQAEKFSDGNVEKATFGREHLVEEYAISRITMRLQFPFLLALILPFLLLLELCSSEVQNITVRGQTICRRRSVKGLPVELREHDTLDPDDSLAATTTGPDGTFEVRGSEDEIRSIRPYLRITHKCDVKDEMKCRRVTDIDIPTEKVNGVYEMNFVNLNLPGHRDTETCDD